MEIKLATNWMAEKLAEMGYTIPPHILTGANTREAWNIADGFEDGNLSKIADNMTIGESAHEYIKDKYNIEASIL